MRKISWSRWWWRGCGFIAVVATIAGCDTPDAALGGNAGDRYVVMVERSPFYRYGPAQGLGPDLNLKNGQVVTLLSREYGYSRVQMDNGQAGYVSNDDLAPAPSPTPVPALAVVPDSTLERGSGGRAQPRKPRRSPTPKPAPLPASMQVNDSPLPEAFPGPPEDPVAP